MLKSFVFCLSLAAMDSGPMNRDGHQRSPNLASKKPPVLTRDRFIKYVASSRTSPIKAQLKGKFALHDEQRRINAS